MKADKTKHVAAFHATRDLSISCFCGKDIEGQGSMIDKQTRDKILEFGDAEFQDNSFSIQAQWSRVADFLNSLTVDDGQQSLGDFFIHEIDPDKKHYTAEDE